MILIKKLISNKHKTTYSYENLIGNFLDGEIGLKIRTELIDSYLERKNLDKDF